MKVTRAAVVIIMMAVSAVEPQGFTRFPELPSPPRITIGGFRPMFRPRSPRRQRFRPPPLFRSSKRPSFFQQQNQFNRIPSRQPLHSLRPPPVQLPTRPATFRPTASIRITPPASSMLPPPPPSPRTPHQPQRGSLVIRFPEQPPSPPRIVISNTPPQPRVVISNTPPQPPSPPRVVISNTPPQPLSPPRVVISSTPQRDARGFGSPKPNSIVSNFRPSLSGQPNDGKQFSSGASFVVSNELSKSQQSGFPRPLPRQNDNDIIGMFPPPLRPVTTTLAPFVVAQTTATLASTPLTSALQNTSPSLATLLNTSPSMSLSNPTALISLTSSNSLNNELPLVNAGVLPLAGENENEHMLFPPFTHLRIPSDLLSDQELFPPFPPNQDLFPPFNSN